MRQRAMPRSTGWYSPSPPCSTSTSRPAMPRSAPPCCTYVGVSLARTTMSCRLRRFVPMTSLRELSGFALGRMPTRASSGAVSSKIRPFDNAMLMLAMCNHPGNRPKRCAEGGGFYRKALGYALDPRAEGGELFFQRLVAPIEVVDAVDQRFALRDEPGDDETGGG